jgi:YidC/Oxa1 family membrane protein insertase
VGDNNNFLDKNTILAIGLSILFFVGWQFYVQKNYPQANKNKVEKIEAQKNPSVKNVESTSPDNITPESSKQIVKTDEVPLVEEIINVENTVYTAQLSSNGMGFNIIELNNYSDRSERKISFTNNNTLPGNFSTLIDNKPLKFKIQKESEQSYVGTALFDGTTILKKIKFNEDNYTIDVSIQAISGSVDKDKKIETFLSNQVLKVKSSFFTPAYEGTEVFAINEGEEERKKIDIEKPYNQQLSQTSLASIGSQYFAVALKDNSTVIPKTTFTYEPKEQIAIASVEYEAQTLNSATGIQYKGFVGPKKYDILKTIDSDFVKMINYGIFSILSKPILTLLKWLYSLFQNWGLAIILLTVFIRLLLLPINISSLKSMKKMQKIQPLLKSIKEKYKDDPVRVNQETMALMKKEKANPLGGCLPMLLQLPVFFALYSVLGQSVELYKSPFIFWIHDLSYQDPFFVLPIAVGALYFIQMNITPQPMDPAQAKVMKFIPILFSFFMITVPSGLTLYFFVNTVFGIGQQLVFQKEKKKAAA